MKKNQKKLLDKIRKITTTKKKDLKQLNVAEEALVESKKNEKSAKKQLKESRELMEDSQNLANNAARDLEHAKHLLWEVNEKKEEAKRYHDEAKQMVKNAVQINKNWREAGKKTLSMSRNYLDIACKLTDNPLFSRSKQVARCEEVMDRIRTYLSKSEEGELLIQEYKNTMKECEVMVREHFGNMMRETEETKANICNDSGTATDKGTGDPSGLFSVL